MFFFTFEIFLFKFFVIGNRRYFGFKGSILIFDFFYMYVLFNLDRWKNWMSRGFIVFGGKNKIVCGYVLRGIFLVVV